MKLLLIGLFSTLASIMGQELMMMEAPELVVFYLNEKATPETCSEKELFFIDSKMLPDLDMTLQENNYETPDWSLSVETIQRKLAPASAANGSNCDFCRRLYPAHLCNAMFNCRFRRQLRNAQTSTRKLNTEALSSGLLQDCKENIAALSKSRFLSRACQVAIGAATCHVEFV